jgi:hypothetical protein
LGVFRSGSGLISACPSWSKITEATCQAQIPFPQYFDQIEKAIPASNCSTDIIQIRALVDQILAGNSTNEEPDIPKITTDAMKSLIFEAVTNSTFNLTEVTLDVDPDALSSSVLDLTRNFLNAFSFFQVRPPGRVSESMTADM